MYRIAGKYIVAALMLNSVAQSLISVVFKVVFNYVQLDDVVPVSHIGLNDKRRHVEFRL